MNMGKTNRLVQSIAVLSAIVACLVLVLPDAAVGGIQGSGLRLLYLVGRITGFGSIYVNGVEYSTAHANVVIDGRSGTESQLQAGQIVTLEGTVNDDGRTGEASRVEFFGDVVGPVTNVKAPQQRFEMLGQTVQVSADTLFGGTELSEDLSGLTEGTYLEVSGFTDSRGVLVAARVDPVAASTTPQVRGNVAGLHVKEHSFHINGLNVNYSGASIEGSLRNRADVKVQGRLAGATLLATSVVVVPDALSAGAKGHVEGIVTSFESAAAFTVNDQPVVTTPKTKFALRRQILAPDLPVTVEGVFNRAGVLVAKKVTVRPQSSVAVKGTIDSIEDDLLVVAGTTVQLADTTIFEDHSQLHLRTLTVSDLSLGDYVEVDGACAGQNAVLAATLKREDSPQASLKAKGKAGAPNGRI